MALPWAVSDPSSPLQGWSRSLPTGMIPWRSLKLRAGAAINPLQMMSSTSHCAKMLLLYPDGHSSNGKGHRYSLLGISVARMFFLEHGHLSLVPWATAPCPFLQHFVQIRRCLKIIVGLQWEATEWQSPCPGMGSTSPTPDLSFQSFCCFPFNKMFGRKKPHQYPDFCRDSQPWP